MALSVINPNEFDLFITCVDKVGPMLKIWGQCDRLSSMFVEQLLKMSHNTFELNPTPLHMKKLQVGTLCCAKYKDGIYYRAKITNLRSLVSGSIEVNFIDYGNIETIQLENIRLLENVAVGLATMKPQATDFILANVIHINQDWDENALAFVHQDIAYIELKCTVVGAVNNYKFISVSFHGNDLADYLVQKGIAMKIPLASQENFLRNSPAPRMMHPGMHGQVQMQQIHQNPPIQIPIHQPPPPVFQQMQQPPPPQQSQQMSPMATPELCSYRTLPLEPNSEHMVYVSYVEDGPFLFSIQLQSMEESLTKLMIEINQITNLLPLNESPLPGYPCMARCLEDESLCRAVIINLVEDKCKTYYVDFGNTDILPFSNIFQIPFKYMLPKVMSMRFTLHELKNVNVTTEMKCQFKEYVTNRLLKLKVLKLESSPVLQYCELYDENNQNIIEVLYGATSNYKTIQVNKGQKLNVIVSFIEGCKKFFVQLKDSSEALANLMRNLASCCEFSPPLQKIDVGMACVAFYSGDNQWYRAQIINVADNAATVKYVDYGNVDTVAFNCLKKIDPNFVKILPAQAIECCLYGYQNMSFNTEIENVFESLTLECEFSMRVIAKQSNDCTVLVDLFDGSGNNVAALLIEKLASQKSELLSPGPLPANKVTRSLSLLSNENENAVKNTNTVSPRQDPKSPRTEKYSWRNSDNDKTPPKQDNDRSWKNSGDRRSDDRRPQKSFGDEKKSWRSSERNIENMPPQQNSNRENNRNQNHNGWNGDSPTNKRPHQRNERSFSRNSRDSDSNESKNKFRSDKFENNKMRSNDKRQSPQNDFGGKKSNWNNSGSESEKSWSGSVGNRSNSKKDFNNRPSRRQNNDFPKKNDYAPKGHIAKAKPELPPQDLVPLEQPFNYPEINPGMTVNISISWFYDPENFYIQLKDSQNVFRDMMTEIQTAYNGRPAFMDTIPVGSSVIAEFHEDNVLYRATVVESKHPKYKVQYIDFGNMSLVDNKKIWQVERKFMELPIQAIKCGVLNVKPANDAWVMAEDLDRIFNKEFFTATFDGCDEDKYYVQIFDNELNIRQQLIDCGLAVDPTSTVQMMDEPIDSNILLGQNINVKISFVDSYNVFYVHLEKEKANIVNEAINNFMQEIPVESLLKLTEELLVIGSSCLVKFDETTWRRAVIMDNSNLAELKVAYPDFGGNAVYSSDQLYTIPSELCIYWYQAFECSLHNLTETCTKLMTDSEFKEKYEGKDFIIYVDEVVDSRLIVTLYDLTGTKIELLEPDEDAYPTVDPICPLPVFSQSLPVWVCHINNVSSIYLQRNCDEQKIADLLHNLHEYYETQGETKEFNKDDLCVAKSEDGNWYRGRVEEIIDDSFKILYIDYGNTENVLKENLKVLDLTQFGMHELALHASLNLQEVSDELTAKLKEILTDQLFTASLMYGETGWFVDLTNNELNVNQTLIDANLAVALGAESYPIETIAEETAVIHDDVQQEIVEGEETRAQITITHIDSPSEFYVQLVANEDSIFALQADLQEKVVDLPDLDSADIGAFCAAKYTVDEQWYRAEVLDADAEITTVRFIDYGNTDVITNEQSSIKTLPADLLSIDKYARKCSLNIKPIIDEEWSKEASEMFEAAVNFDVVIHADIVYQDEKNKTYVELFVNGNNVAQQLLENNLAVPIDRDIEDNIANNSGFVSHLNSVSEFWIQLESSVPDLEMIVDRLASADTFPDLQDLSPGVLCAANFPDDEMWYRARILSNTVAGVEVLFVDYGNSSTAMKLKVLPEDLIQMPPLAQKFSLNKPANVDNWSEPANEKFREISAEGATIFTIKKLAAGETSIVELFVDEQNILDQLVELCDLNSTPVTPVSQQKSLKITLTHVESPDHFWVQLHSDNVKIDEMMETLASAGTFEKLTDFNADTTCAALYEYSSLWYRAKIYENLGDEGYEVLLVDYGNTINTKDLRVLPSEIEEMPPLATLCTLELPEGTTEWNNAAIKNFTELAANKNGDFRVEFIDNEVPSKVKLYLDGKNVVDQICANQPEKPSASSTTVTLTTDEVTQLAVNTVLPETLLNGEDDDDLYDDSTLKLEDSSVLESNNQDEIKPKSSDETKNETAESVECCSLNANQDNNLTSEEFTSESNDNNIATELNGDGLLKEKQTNNIDVLALGDGTSTNILKDDLVDIDELHENTTDSELLTNNIETSKNSVDEICEPQIEESNNDDNNIDLEAGTNGNDINLDKKATNEEHDSVTYSCETGELEESVITKDVEMASTDGNDINLDKKATSEEHDSITYSCETGGLEESVITKDVEIISSRPSTPPCDRILPGTICQGDLETPPEEKIPQILNETFSENIQVICKTAPPRNEKIVPGSISRGEEKIQYEFEPVVSRPATPLSEKIVPGSINRGDLSVPPEDEPTSKSILESVMNETEISERPATPKIPLEDKILPGCFNQEVVKLQHEFEPVVSRPATPLSEKIVPGSINRGDLSEPPEDEPTSKSIVESVMIETEMSERPATPKIPLEDKVLPGCSNQEVVKLQHELEPVVSRPETPLSEKIVPGSINRDDLSEPPEDEPTSKSIVESVMNETEMSERPATPKIPLEENVLPGCSNQEVVD